MGSRSPGPLTAAERRARRERAARIARQLGFVGRVEYRHVYSQTGGAQYGRGTTQEEESRLPFDGFKNCGTCWRISCDWTQEAEHRPRRVALCVGDGQ